ncbi:pyridoxal phosphate-dependent decarboxylase family protein [Actinomadura rupiterrae]|uniref:pyridoxal phosphate-dependent decarboxylase family protein n=1 Tax=Actinomadura rupiterrae TaxID=559627 RepID=UPI0020A4F8F0|nr:pyridoxal-dependent decarboxylase [Actinomadura rupiterrae]MCP2339342.1 glutamate/tyrosine decarboxylase-like PLP-dependent enzyme [Actinomadura rupiterrae]
MSTPGTAFAADHDQRRMLFDALTGLVQEHLDELPGLPVTPETTPEALRVALKRFDFEDGADPFGLLAETARMLRDGIVHTSHPSYFGLFNPAPALMGVLGEALTAAFNPQLAAWSHAPAAAEIERHVLGFLGGRLGWQPEATAGSFTTGGAEANLTGVLLALTRAFPAAGRDGLRALPGRPVLYASAESHLAWLKIAHMCGLGRDAVRLVPVGSDLRMDVAAAVDLIARDRRDGHLPFLLVGTAGTTSAGIIDPLPELVGLAAAEGLSFHADAAWAGAVALSDRLRPLLDGIERADSVTLDAHKWLAMPMGAGTFLTRDASGLREAFSVHTAYMPDELPETVDPYASSVQWSRRAMGVKLFLTLATAGRTGYADLIEHQTALGDVLRNRLDEAGWTIVAPSPLPVVCFTRPDATADDLEAVADRVVRSGRAWISTTRLAGRPALRACITNFATTETEIEALVDLL